MYYNKLLSRNDTQSVPVSIILGKSLKKSFLDLLISISDEFPDQITDKDIQEEVDTFFFEGHDTSSLSITITLLLLGIYPDVQVRYYVSLEYFFFFFFASQ